MHFDGRIQEYTISQYWIFSQHVNVGDGSQHCYPHFYPLPAEHDQYTTEQCVQTMRENIEQLYHLACKNLQSQSER